MKRFIPNQAAKLKTLNYNLLLLFNCYHCVKSNKKYTTLDVNNDDKTSCHNMNVLKGKNNNLSNDKM